MNNNVNLWFARNSNDEIITINDINLEIKDKYHCPLCGSEVIPKAIKEKSIVRSHFAHIDRSKCEGESLIHWWCKNKMLNARDTIKFKINGVLYKYICKEIHIEKLFSTRFGTYNPDITIVTECGQIIFYEINYRNKKNKDEYYNKWLELGNTVIEVKVNLNGESNYKVLFDNKKLLSRDCITEPSCLLEYKNHIYQKDKVSNKDVEKIRLVDWFWKDVLKYKQNKVKIEEILSILKYIEDKELEGTINKILKTSKCNKLMKDIIEFKSNELSRSIPKSDNIKLTYRLGKIAVVYNNIIFLKLYNYNEKKEKIFKHIEKVKVVLEQFKHDLDYIQEIVSELNLDTEIVIEDIKYPHINNLDYIKIRFSKELGILKTLCLYKHKSNEYIKKRIEEYSKLKECRTNIIDILRNIKLSKKVNFKTEVLLDGHCIEIYAESEGICICRRSINPKKFKKETKEFIQSTTKELDNILYIETNRGRLKEIINKINDNCKIAFRNDVLKFADYSRKLNLGYDCDFIINKQELKIYNTEKKIKFSSLSDLESLISKITSDYLRDRKYDTGFDLNNYL